MATHMPSFEACCRETAWAIRSWLKLFTSTKHCAQKTRLLCLVVAVICGRHERQVW